MTCMAGAVSDGLVPYFEMIWLLNESTRLFRFRMS